MSVCRVGFFFFLQLYFNTICFPVFAICFLFLTISSLYFPPVFSGLRVAAACSTPLKPAAAVGHGGTGALQEVHGATLLPERPRCALRVRRHLPRQLQQPDLLGGGVQEELAGPGDPQVAAADDVLGWFNVGVRNLRKATPTLRWT